MEDNKKVLQCPRDCPFLENRSFLPGVLPFYCSKFSVYLGVDSANKVQKHYLCLGVKQNVIHTGLSLLESQIVSRPIMAQLKKAFLDMPVNQQKNFVMIVSQTGIQLKPSPYDRISPFWLMREMQKGWELAKKREQSPEVQDFIKLLSVVGGGTPLDGMTKTLLSNLFQVLDGSERSMLISIMENPQNLKSFLKRFEKTPKDSDLLKNFRALLYDTNESLQSALINSQKNHAPRVITNGSQERMRHVLQKMTQVRSSKTKTY